MTQNLSSLKSITKHLPKILGEPRLRNEVIMEIKKNPTVYSKFLTLSEQFQEEMLAFCMGNRGVKISYDPFFKKIFDPETYPSRLSNLLTCIIGEKITVKRALPREHDRLSEAGSLLIMDILVELSDGTMTNVEIQKNGYAFPGQRGACYSSDLLLRQYDKVKEQRGTDFTYRDLKPVYCIVLLENSSWEFHQHPQHYIHRSEQSFDTGLQLEHLQKFIYIPLDIFLSIPHNKITELEAWLYFLGSDAPEHICMITRKYPMFRQLYQDICQFRYKPEELVNMYSEALSILDRNTVQFMIEEQKKEIEKLKQEKATMEQEDKKQIKSLEQENAHLRKLLAEKNKEI
ncbi:PD-(D/E)XK nuclease family transposase [Roseburia sp. 499]|uniref:PD-(D/E)XK nuclease family transposase n=1 Tax=Roseburia sp. 499 TaxID=1261634 RepID=UPI0009FA546E|nr:PD-(D/E)XK nuclease family transposase [Roseburia sp. 499]WVK70277.1 PD-(D/E)XK nuclease family transposase [Roseburia sp. 499]